MLKCTWKSPLLLQRQTIHRNSAMARKSWLSIPANSHFSLANIPFGIISTKASPARRPAIAIGDHVLDLKAFVDKSPTRIPNSPSSLASTFCEPNLNAFAALGKEVHKVVRQFLQDVLSEDTAYPQVLKENKELQKLVLISRKNVTMHLPMQIGDYTDFYAGMNHAYTVGVLFRGPENALQPNYTYIPVGYHGRASSIVVSGTPIRRPSGPIIVDPSVSKVPTIAASRRLDIELELGAFVCTPNDLGSPVPLSKASASIFGFVLLNDWSARDIQAFEYVPLGPFNGKNFASSVSPWVVLADALEPFRTSGIVNPTKDTLMDYLKDGREDAAYDIQLEVDLTTPEGNTTTITKTSSKNLLWSFEQMVAHHTIGGCNLQTGDFLGSGTISGKEKGEQGSMLEMNEGGKKDIIIAEMDVRKFLKDGDTITIRGVCGQSGEFVGFGECIGTIESAYQ